MHYCFFTSGSWEWNGGVHRLRELGSALIEQGVQVSYLLDDCEFNRTKVNLHERARREYVPAASTIGMLRERRKLIRVIAPDYVHVLSPSIMAWLTLSGSSVKVIGDWDEWPARRKMAAHKFILARFLDSWLRKRSHRVVVASRYMQEEFEKQFGCRAIYIPHASFVAPQPDGQSPFSEPTAVYMGTFYSVYDHDVLFEAARLLKERGITPKIEFIGDGPDVEKWRSWVSEQKLDNIVMAGYLRDGELWRHVRHAHVLLFPMRMSEVNLYRCPGKTFFYAQARRPTIATRVGEIPQVLGERAEYVECTPAAFADALERAMKAPQLADVDYGLKGWDDRARTLLENL